MRHAKPTVPKESHPFDLGPAAFTSLWNGIALNGIEFHLSPERGGPATPGGPAVVVRYCQELWIPFLIQAALLFKFSSIPSTNFPPCIRRATSPGALTRRHRRLAMSSSL